MSAILEAIAPSLKNSSLSDHPGVFIMAALELQTLILHSTTERSDAIGRLVELGITDSELLKTLDSPYPLIADTRLNARPYVRLYNKGKGTKHQLHSTEWHLVLLTLFLRGVSMQQNTSTSLSQHEAEVLEMVERVFTQSSGTQR